MRRLIIAVLMAASAIMPAMAADVSQETISAEAEPIAIPSMDGSDAKAVSLPADATYEDLGYGRSVLMSSKNPDEVAQVEKPAFIDEVLSDNEDSRGAYIHTKDFTAGDLALTANFYGRHVDIIYPENITKGDIDSFAAELMEASDGAFTGIYYMVYEDLHLVAVSYPEGMGADEAEAWADNIMSFLSAYLGYSSPIDTAVLTTASLMPDDLSMLFMQYEEAFQHMQVRTEEKQPRPAKAPEDGRISIGDVFVFISDEAIPAESSEEPFEGRISVTGNAEVTLEPDIGTFSITASFTEPTTDEARQKTAAMTGEAIRILTEGFGVPADSITTSFITAYPDYSWVDGKQVLNGQKAEESIEIETGDIESIGAMYEALMKLDGITLSDVTLDRKDKSAAMEEARIAAMKAAEDKARTYAETAGMLLGKPVSIREGSGSYVPVYGIQPRMMNVALDMAEGSGAAVKTEYRAGDITVTASVSVEYMMH